MASKNRDKELYMKQYPKAVKWINQCIICGSVGYKPELPETIHPGVLAENLRAFFPPLRVDALSMCESCAKNWINNNTRVS